MISGFAKQAKSLKTFYDITDKTAKNVNSFHRNEKRRLVKTHLRT